MITLTFRKLYNNCNNQREMADLFEAVSCTCVYIRVCVCVCVCVCVRERERE